MRRLLSCGVGGAAGVCLTVLCSSPPALAQSPVPTVRGTTTTARGTVMLADVSVTAVDSSNGRVVQTTTSNGEGRFELLLASGTYDVHATLTGFVEHVERGLRVVADESREVALDLVVAPVTDHVTVKAGAATDAAPSPALTLPGALLDRAPVKDDFQSLLPLLPGVVRSSDGRIHLKGGGAAQSGLQVSSANVTDPSTGDFAFQLPGDAVEAVDLMPNPYAAEYGRFATGVAEIRTRGGGDRWHVVPNSFFPRFRAKSFRWWDIQGLRSFTPRLTLGGPLRKDRWFIAEHLQARFVNTPIQSLDNPTQKLRSFDSYTRADANLSPRQRLTMAFAMFPRTLDYGNLNTFNPPQVTAGFRQSGFNAGTSATTVLSSKAFVDSMGNVKRFDAHEFAYGDDPMRMTPEGNEGSFFNRQVRRTTSVQWVESLTFAARGASGEHLLKVGFDFMRSSYDGSSVSLPVEIWRRDGTLAQRIEFTGPTQQSTRGADLALYAQDRWRPVDRLGVDGGIRFERDGALGDWHLSPRVGAVARLTSTGSTVVRGGVGVFYQRTALNVAAFDSYQLARISSFDATGFLVGDVGIVQHQVGNLQTPRSTTWNIELDQRIGRDWVFKVNHLRRRGYDEYIVDPIAAPAGRALLLESRGRSRYDETELTARYAHGERQEIVVSYVRSQSVGDLNAFDAYFGNLRRPIIRANEYSLSDVDAPNRLLVRGSVGLPRQWDVLPVLEVRDGFPYSVIDENQNFVGPQNRGGRFPVLFTLDLSVHRPVKVLKWRPRVGFRVLNILNSFNPRDVQNNIDSSAFGRFSNPIEVFIGLTFWFDR